MLSSCLQPLWSLGLPNRLFRKSMPSTSPEEGSLFCFQSLSLGFYSPYRFTNLCNCIGILAGLKELINLRKKAVWLTFIPNFKDSNRKAYQSNQINRIFMIVQFAYKTSTKTPKKEIS